MKKLRSFIITLIVVASASMLENCSKSNDEVPGPLKVLNATTDKGVDLNESASATNIPLDAVVLVLFDKAVDPSASNLNSISIRSNDVEVPTDKTVVGSTVYLTPVSNLSSGTNEVISIAAPLKAVDGATSAAVDFTFKTFGLPVVIPPQAGNQLSHFAFSGDMHDESGTHSPNSVDVRAITFVEDRFGVAGMAGDFDGSTSIVEIPDGEKYLENNSLTISVWIKANSAKNGQFVMGLAAWKGFYLGLADDWSSVKLTTQFSQAGDVSNSQDNWFPGTGETNLNGGWQGWTFQKDVLPHGGGVGETFFKDKWAHIVCTYDAAAKLATMFLNGEMVKQQDFNLWPDGDPARNITGTIFAGNLTDGGNKLALGFIQGSQNRVVIDSWADPADLYSNHFQGQMDDLRIFKVALTGAEVSTLYTAEKP